MSLLAVLNREKLFLCHCWEYTIWYFFFFKSSDKPHLLQGRPLRLILLNESGAPCESEASLGLRVFFVSPHPPLPASLCQLLSATGPAFFSGFSWMFSKCHGKCQQSLNQWPTDICPCLVPQPPVSLDLEGGADRPPPCLRHISFPPRVFTPSAQASTFPAKAFDVTISRFAYFIFLFPLFSVQLDDETQASASSICRSKTSPFFIDSGSSLSAASTDSRSADWMCTKEEVLLCQTWWPERCGQN